VGDGDASRSGHAINQVLYHIDGIDVKDDSGKQIDSGGGSRIFDPLEDSIEDVQVVLSALNARNGRTTGGQVNVVTKSGSNEFEGTIRQSINRPSWTANQSHGPNGADTGSAGVTDYEANALNGYSRHTDITFSGPVIKDRLWFYVGTRIQPSETGIHSLGWNGYPVQKVNGSWVPMAGKTIPDVAKYPQITYGMYPNVDAVLLDASKYPTGFGNYDLNWSDWNTKVPADTNFKKYEAKLTGQVTPDHMLTFSYLYSKQVQQGMSGERSDGLYTINKQFMGDLKSEVKAWSLSWNGTISSNWFIEAKA
jgi:hypothetical protein